MRWMLAIIVALGLASGCASSGGGVARVAETDDRHATVARTSATSTTVAVEQTASTATSKSTSLATTTVAANPCATIAEVLDRVDTLDGDGSVVADELAAQVRVLRQLDDAPAELRVDIEQLVTILDLFDWQLHALIEARPGVDDESGSAIDRLVATMPTFIRSLGADESLGTLAPAVNERCDVGRPWSRADEWHAERFADALHDFEQTQVATDPEFATLKELAANMAEARRRIEGDAQSGMDQERDQCFDDRGARTVGDSSGCDALHAACDARNLGACNDLYFASNPGSDYEAFGMSCGGRVALGDEAFAGFCERLDEHGLTRS